MRVKTLHIPNSRLSEGRTYTFTILKSISLTPDESFFVMLDPLGYKILMPGKYYARYGFEPGQKILCRVDKVNCNGRMFLEPQHPHYKEGYTYDFEVVEAGCHASILLKDEYFIKVKDVLGDSWNLTTRNRDLIIQPPSVLSCKLQRIKKGQLYLFVAGESQQHTRLLPGTTLAFQIVGEDNDVSNGLSYFILEDGSGIRHKLVKKYYRHYQLHLDDTINCKVMHLSYDGTYVLEPEHPCYKNGNEYDFMVDRLEELVFSDGFRQKVLVLKDCFEEDVKVFVNDSLADELEEGQYTTARVVEVYKSRLELEL